MRVIQSILGALALILIAAVVALAATVYVAVSTPHMNLLRWGLGHVGRVFVGQRTSELTLSVHVKPRERELTAHATLRLQSTVGSRNRFYFLMNPGLRVTHVAAVDSGGASFGVQAYQAALLLILTTDRPVAGDETITVSLTYEGQPVLNVLGGANVFNEREVLINVDGFWYPVDAQSFFSADITVRLPRSMTLVYNASEADTQSLGDEQVIHWRSSRAVAGLALVAGPYTAHESSDEIARYRVFVADDIHLDPAAVLGAMKDADEALTELLGASGFDTSTMFVSRGFRRGFNDGSGVIGMSLRYFRADDAGFGLVAHEMAHNWFGATVSGGWLKAGQGAQWIVEGFAELASLLATEAKFGADAVTERLVSEFFDPARQQPVAQMSVLDNALDEPRARDTIYRKGAYVLWMLRHALGDETFLAGLRELATRFQYGFAGDADVEQIFETASGQNLDAFFSDWVRGNTTLDLSLDALDTGRLQISNLGKATLPGTVTLWAVPKAGGEPAHITASLGESIHFEKDTVLIVDPLLNWADVTRENNRYPRREDPFALAVGPAAQLAIAVGEPRPWGRTAMLHLSAENQIQHTWELPRGLLQPPVWSADGKFIIANVSDPADIIPNVVVLHTDNRQQTVGKAVAPAAGANQDIFAARDDRIVRFALPKQITDVIRHPKATLEQTLPSPAGDRLAYLVARRNSIDLRLVNMDGKSDRSLLTWDRDRTVLRWSPDGDRLYAIIGGDADWQVWSIEASDGSVRVLARDAAAAGDLAVSPDGSRLVFSAAEAHAYPRTRRQLYLLDLQAREVRNISVPERDLSALAWQDNETVLVIGSAVPDHGPLYYPRERSLYRIHTSSAEVELVR